MLGGCLYIVVHFGVAFWLSKNRLFSIPLVWCAFFAKKQAKSTCVLFTKVAVGLQNLHFIYKPCI